MTIKVRTKFSFVERFLATENCIRLDISFVHNMKKHSFHKWIMDQEDMRVTRANSAGDEQKYMIDDLAFFCAVSKMMSKPENIQKYVEIHVKKYIEDHISIDEADSAKKSMLKTLRKHNYNFTIEI